MGGAQHHAALARRRGIEGAVGFAGGALGQCPQQPAGARVAAAMRKARGPKAEAWEARP